MDSLNLRIEEMLGYLDTYGTGNFDDERVEKLEAILQDCNKNMNNLYVEPVPDSIYDYLYETLKKVKPSSGIFAEIWDEEGDITDYTDLLVKNPMMSIETAKSYNCDALTNFISRLPEETSYFASYKINGHGIRVVYKDGDLVSATSRGRSSASRDLTEKLRWILGAHNSHLEDYGLVELRGELALKVDRLNTVREKYNSEVKSAFSAVSSLIRPSSTKEETELLDFLCYGMICDGFNFTDRDDEFQEIANCGFLTPEFMFIESIRKGDMLDTIKDIVQVFEENYEEFGYFCDGVVLEVSNRDLFNEMGIEGNHNKGNIALKVGVWEQVTYSGYVNCLLWTRGKVKLSPVAIISDNPDDVILDENGEPENLNEIGVLTSQGNRVKRVPLYEPKNILTLEAYPGNILSFRYGGEAGVVPCFPDGRLLKEDAVKDLLSEDSGDSWGDFNKASF